MTSKVNHEELKEHIKKCYKTKISLFVKGTMGIGKSDTLRQTAREIAEDKGLEYIEDGYGEGKFGVIDARLSQYTPEDLKGLPTFNKENKTTEWLLPEVLPRCGSGILFFDELNLASPSIQAAAYQIILDRKLGTYKVPEGWAVIAAGNGTEDRANIFELPAPLANRFAHTELSPPSVDNWAIWAAGNGVNMSIISFLHFKNSYLYKFDSNSNDVAFATPRSWTFASKLIEGETKDNIIKRYMSSCVGEGIAIEYMAYHKMANELDIDDIIKNSERFKSPKDINQKYAVAGALAEKYNKNPKILKNLCNIWLKFEPEFTVISIKMCRAYKPKAFVSEMLKLPEWDKLSREYTKYLS